MREAVKFTFIISCLTALVVGVIIWPKIGIIVIAAIFLVIGIYDILQKKTCYFEELSPSRAYALSLRNDRP
jgi:hypothetical protein